LFMPPERPNGIRLLYDRATPGASKNQEFSTTPVENSPLECESPALALTPTQPATQTT
jgi:hypothetical protein